MVMPRPTYPCECGVRHLELLCRCGMPVVGWEQHQRWVRDNPRYHRQLIEERAVKRMNDFERWQERSPNVH